jgi:hypothetical protein
MPQANTSTSARVRSRSRISDARVLQQRRRTAEMLDISYTSVLRLEWAGKLQPVRLKPGGTVFQRVAEVLALANGERHP